MYGACAQPADHADKSDVVTIVYASILVVARCSMRGTMAGSSPQASAGAPWRQLGGAAGREIAPVGDPRRASGVRMALGVNVPSPARPTGCDDAATHHRRRASRRG